MSDQVVGIIGGGVGGLSVAWCLHEQAKAAGMAPPVIHIFEKNNRFGGNADTKEFDFKNGPGYEDKPLKRWADMGVNDFNTAAYGNIVDVMKVLKFTKGKDYRNLEDSTTYYDTKGETYFTANSYEKDGKSVPDPWWGTVMDNELQSSVDSFMYQAGQDNKHHKYSDLTVEQYIEKFSEEYKWSKDLGPKVIYPRINGMYFTSGPLGPRQMPFAAVMHYYRIQEGAGGVKADRNYFVGGASKWINSLINYMSANMPEIHFHKNWDALVQRTPGSPGTIVVSNSAKGASDKPVFASKIVLATPANDAMRLSMQGYNEKGTDGEALFSGLVANIMSQVKYETAVSVAHTDARLMPVNRNAWSTYNIVIHEPGSVALKPYVINYVANRHQNDAANPEFNKFGLPEFFLSINPHMPISEDKVLKDEDGNPAVANLSHFVFDFDCMKAQADIVAQQGIGNIYYASGWTAGSGLHTECWQQGSDVAAMMLKSIDVGEHVPEEPVDDHLKFMVDRLNKIAPC